jgi:hypothetical protein
MKRLLVATFALFTATTVFAFGEPTHSKIEVAATPAGDQMEFTFKVIANEGHAVTFDAPWKLDLKKHDGLAFDKAALNKADMDEKIPGWKVKTSAKPANAQGEMEYQLVAFICTTNKTQCYREVHKGKAAWKQ